MKPKKINPEVHSFFYGTKPNDNKLTQKIKEFIVGKSRQAWNLYDEKYYL